MHQYLVSVPIPVWNTLFVLLKYVPIPQRPYQLYMCVCESLVEVVFVLQWAEIKQCFSSTQHLSGKQMQCWIINLNWSGKSDPLNNSLIYFYTLS